MKLTPNSAAGRCFLVLCGIVALVAGIYALRPETTDPVPPAAQAPSSATAMLQTRDNAWRRAWPVIARRPPLRLFVRVYTAAARPTEARVLVRDVLADEVRAHPTVDGRVTVRRDLAEPAAFEVWAEGANGSRSVTTRFIASPLRTLRAELMLDHVVLRGLVTSTAGDPVAGAVVQPKENVPGSRTRAVTDEQGHFEMMVPSDEARTALVAYHKFHYPSKPGTSEPGSAFLFSLRPRLSLRGRVRTSDGSSVAGVALRVTLLTELGPNPPQRRDDDPFEGRLAWVLSRPRSNRELAQVRVEIPVEIEPSGTFETPLPFAANATVIATLKDYTAAVLTTSVQLGDTQRRTIVLEPSALRGARLRIVQDDGKPWKRVLAWIQENKLSLEQKTYLKAKTDDDGYIDISPLTPGEEVLVTITPDPDDESSDAPPGRAPGTWVVRADVEYIHK